MSDLIDRQEAIDALTRTMVSIPTAGGKDLMHDENRIRVEDILVIKRLQSAEPDIIACGDCKHWICHDRRCGYWNHGVKPLDWCCHAERRTDE